jgi:hypothetical protein
MTAESTPHLATVDALPPPWGLSPEAVGNREAWGTIAAHGVSLMYVVHDPLREVGAIYTLGNARWTLYTPIGAAEFAEIVEQLVRAAVPSLAS